MNAASSSALQRAALGLDAVAPHGGEHARGLLAAHHADARVRPHPQEARRVRAAAHAVVAGAEAAADDDRELRHRARVATAVTIFAPCLAMPSASYLRPTMKPVMFCRNTSGTLRWQHSSMKCAPFSATLGEQDAVVGDDADRHALDVREAGDQRGAVARLELVELAAVDDARDHLAHVVRLARVGRDHAVAARPGRAAGGARLGAARSGSVACAS